MAQHKRSPQKPKRRPKTKPKGTGASRKTVSRRAAAAKPRQKSPAAGKMKASKKRSPRKGLKPKHGKRTLAVSQRAAGGGTRPAAVPRRAPRVAAKAVSPRVEKLKTMLEAKSAEILEKIKRARAESLDIDHTSFAEVGDLVSASVEKEKAFEHGEAGVNALREIAGALEKLKGGTYGICERCGKPIGVKRLEAMPSARLCVKCKAKEEAVGKVVAPPADNAFED